MDSHGRVFYIDHATRTTSWTRPGGGSSGGSSNGVGAEQQRRQLDRRYQSIRRTISSYQFADGDQSAMAPGCMLITRPDFFTVLHMNQVLLSSIISISNIVSIQLYCLFRKLWGSTIRMLP